MTGSRGGTEVSRFCRQCQQLEAHKDLDWPSGQVLRDDEAQRTLYDALCGGTRPLPPRYQLRVLKELVRIIEEAIEDWDVHGVSDDLMGCLTELMAQPLPDEMVAVQQKSYVTYTLSLLDNLSGPNSRPQITMLESRNLIAAGGTTGLRTWEAALHLGQWLCRETTALNTGDHGESNTTHSITIKDKRILELGAGTGYLAILCAKYLGAAQVIASDGSDDVVATLPDNFYLNGLQDDERLTALDLKWGHALLGTEEAEWNGGRPVDVVLGADITYDKSVIPALVSTVATLFGKFPGVVVIIAATERNRETFEAFLEVCQRRRFVVDEVDDFDVPRRRHQGGPFYSDSVPIRICRISKT
ncbi:putative methyltransferase-domain-containing protein [Microdochium trichocladiopsis]|uniref:Methyltransferase-domain-containing protein n=1 Tax=Microdochium trichocladiopsis TaxID=1682393 RepID=A0A9P8XYX9_9PEZI|nr:putative methyltransferase-domain-containing protein [Microdochium trichocladiopsis]KAH7025697.1 putative methyltransferase-domain-containing protein [Microdochium trichocladiopsis]